MDALKGLLIAGAITLASILPTKQANAFDGNLDYIYSENDVNSFKAHVFYELPKEIKGSSFIKLNGNNGDYFGKTNLEKEVTGGFNVALQAKYSDTPFYSVGLGISRQVPTPRGIFLKLRLLPLWFDKEGKQNNEFRFTYRAKAELPLGAEISSFGEWNLVDEEGIQWVYGEIFLNTEITDGVRFGYNPGFLNDGDATPDVEHRITIRASF